MRNAYVAHILQDNPVLIERMSRQIDAYQFLLLVQTLQKRPLGGFGDGRCGNQVGMSHITEQRELGLHAVSLILGSVTDQDITEHLVLAAGLYELLAPYLGEAVKRSGHSQVLNVLTVAGAQVHALYKVKDALVRTVRLALAYYGRYCILAHTLDRCHTETDIALGVDTESGHTLVHIGTENVDAHGLALVHELGNLGYITCTAKYGSHIL